MTIENRFLHSLIIVIAVSFFNSSAASAANLIVCTRSKLNDFRASAQNLDGHTSRQAKKLSVCASFVDEVQFWLGFYHSVSGAPAAPLDASREGASFSDALGAAADLRAARNASRAEKWSEARIRYDSYTSKRPNDHQVIVERAFTIIWEKKYLDAEKQFDALMKSRLPDNFLVEASRGKKIAVSLQKTSVDSPPQVATNSQLSEVSEKRIAAEGYWIASPSVSSRGGSDSLTLFSIGVRTQRVKKGIYDDQASFEVTGARIISNAIGSRVHALASGVAGSGRLDFGEGINLYGRLGFYGVESGLLHGEVKSSFRILPGGVSGSVLDSLFVIGVERTPLLLLVPLSRGDLAVARDSVYSEFNFGRMLEMRYALAREKNFSSHDRLDLNLSLQLSGNRTSLVNEGSNIQQSGTSVKIMTSTESHPRPSPYYLADERVDVVRIGYEFLHAAPEQKVTEISIMADVGTAFVKARNPMGRDSQVGLWGLRASLINNWSKSVGSHVSLVHQVATRDINESLLRSQTVMQLSMSWIL